MPEALSAKVRGQRTGGPHLKGSSIGQEGEKRRAGLPLPGSRWRKSPQLGMETGSGPVTQGSGWCAHTTVGVGVVRGGAVSRQEGLKVQRGHPEGGAPRRHCNQDGPRYHLQTQHQTNILRQPQPQASMRSITTSQLSHGAPGSSSNVPSR